MPDEATHEDALDALRARVRATQEAAERLVGEANADAERRTPPRGWEPPRAAAGDMSEEVRALVALLESARELLPEELRQQVAELVRQLLLVARALIDWLVDRLESGPRGEAPPVEDIPIS